MSPRDLSKIESPDYVSNLLIMLPQNNRIQVLLPYLNGLFDHPDSLKVALELVPENDWLPALLESPPGGYPSPIARMLDRVKCERDKTVKVIFDAVSDDGLVKLFTTRVMGNVNLIRFILNKARSQVIPAFKRLPEDVRAFVFGEALNDWLFTLHNLDADLVKDIFVLLPNDKHPVLIQKMLKLSAGNPEKLQALLEILPPEQRLAAVMVPVNLLSPHEGNTDYSKSATTLIATLGGRSCLKALLNGLPEEQRLKALTSATEGKTVLQQVIDDYNRYSTYTSIRGYSIFADTTAKRLCDMLQTLPENHLYELLRTQMNQTSVLDILIKTVRETVGLSSTRYNSPSMDHFHGIITTFFKMPESFTTHLISIYCFLSHKRDNLRATESCFARLFFTHEAEKLLEQLDKCNSHDDSKRVLMNYFHDPKSRFTAEILDTIKSWNEMSRIDFKRGQVSP